MGVPLGSGMGFYRAVPFSRSISATSRLLRLGRIALALDVKDDLQPAAWHAVQIGADIWSKDRFSSA